MQSTGSRAQAPEDRLPGTGSRGHRLLGTGSVVVAPGLSCSMTWGFPRSGTRPVSAALAGGFFTTKSPGKSPHCPFPSALGSYFWFLGCPRHLAQPLSSLTHLKLLCSDNHRRQVSWTLTLSTLSPWPCLVLLPSPRHQRWGSEAPGGLPVSAEACTLLCCACCSEPGMLPDVLMLSEHLLCV